MLPVIGRATVWLILTVPTLHYYHLPPLPPPVVVDFVLGVQSPNKGTGCERRTTDVVERRSGATSYTASTLCRFVHTRSIHWEGGGVPGKYAAVLK